MGLGRAQARCTCRQGPVSSLPACWFPGCDQSKLSALWQLCLSSRPCFTVFIHAPRHVRAPPSPSLVTALMTVHERPSASPQFRQRSSVAAGGMSHGSRLYQYCLDGEAVSNEGILDGEFCFLQTLFNFYEQIYR